MLTFAPMSVNVRQIKVNTIDNGAVLNIGPSQHIDIFITYKRNQGIGEQNGDLSPMSCTYSMVTDMDLIDSPSMKNSIV